MIWAVGVVGQVCRLIIETPDEETARRQRRQGEVVVRLDAAERGVIRAGDGGWIVEPAVFDPPWRVERNRRLAASDWTQMADTPLSAEARAAWGRYRQSLRDHEGAGPMPLAPDEHTN